MADAIEVLKKEGATIVDADIPSVVDPDPKNNFLLWGGACEQRAARSELLVGAVVRHEARLQRVARLARRRPRR